MTLTRTRILGILGVVACAILVAIPAAARKPPALTGPETISVTAQAVPLDRDAPEKRRFGKLIWRATLQLTSPAPNFGGYSGIEVDSTGTRLVAISDAGSWLMADLAYQRGRISKLTKAKIGPLRTLKGAPLEGRHIDAESIALKTPGAIPGDAYISFERNHRIGVFPLSADGVSAPRRYLTLPPQARSASSNRGLEAITVLQAGPAKGALLAMTEEYLDEAGNHVGWLIGGPKAGRLTLKRLGGFSVTDLATLPGGDVVVLERRFRFSEGVKMRMRRIKAKTIRPGALLEGEILFAADSLLEIDNMEGLAAFRDAEGKTVLLVIADDNFNSTFQRTLLMQFELPDD